MFQVICNIYLQMRKIPRGLMWKQFNEEKKQFNQEEKKLKYIPNRYEEYR